MRTRRIVHVLVAATLTALASSAVELAPVAATPAALVPRPAALTPDERSCASPPTVDATISSSLPIIAATCSLTVTTPGRAYVTASTSVYPRPNGSSGQVQGVISVDGIFQTASSRLVDLIADSTDGSDRALATQHALDITPGTHTFAFSMWRPSATTTPRALHPTISVLFVPDGDELTGCSAGPTQHSQQILDDGSRQLETCGLTVSGFGTLRITAAGGVIRDRTILEPYTVILVDGHEVGRVQTRNNSNGVDKSTNYVFFQQAVAVVGAGVHQVSLKAEGTNSGVDRRFTVVDPTIQAVFVPATSATTTSCSDDDTTVLVETVISCTVTLPRDGRVEVLAGGGALASSGFQAGHYQIDVNGVDRSDMTGRYVDLYGTVYSMTVLTQFAASVPAGTYTFSFLQRTGSGVSIRNPSIFAIGMFPEEGQPAPPDPPAPPAPPDQPGPTPPETKAPDFVPLVPERVLDTRASSAVGSNGTRPAAGQLLEVQVTGVGSSNVPADAKAVVLNLTGVGASANGFVTVWPCGAPQPTASNLNVVTGANVPNLVIAKVGAGGRVCLFTQPSQDLVADISGYMPQSSTYVPLVPDRVLDTRPSGQVGYSGPKPGVGGVVAVDVTGVGTSQLPDDAAAVVLNVTGTEASADGFVTVWPCGSPQPTASNLNLSAGVDRPNLVVTKVGDGGRVCLFTQSGAHLIADVNGYLPPSAQYMPIVPVRLLDTRAPGQVGYTGAKPGPGAVVQLHVRGSGAASDSATAVVLNVTGTEASADGFVTVWPCGAPQPTASNLNLTAGSTAPNLVMSKIGDGGDVCLFTQSGAHLVADLAGWWTG